MQSTTSTVKTTTPVVEARNAWRWGFTPQAEIWNGRLAMLGFTAAALIEIFSGQGFLHFWGIL
jgi:Chlorophyll A-B binding protein